MMIRKIKWKREPSTRERFMANATFAGAWFERGNEWVFVDIDPDEPSLVPNAPSPDWTQVKLPLVNVMEYTYG